MILNYCIRFTVSYDPRVPVSLYIADPIRSVDGRLCRLGYKRAGANVVVCGS